MAKNSHIEWTHHTFNPWWGCAKVSAACDNCYAETWAKRVGQQVWGKESPRRFFSDAHWEEPVLWNENARLAKTRQRVFCASMADVFERRAELKAPRQRLWDLIASTPWLDWLLLTKRPQNIASMISWSQEEWPRNVWLGTTVETQGFANKRLPHLLKHKAAVRFLSCEPLLGPIDLTRWFRAEGLNPIDWVKSVTVCDLLSQTECFYDYTVIVEEGLSYEIYTRTIAPDARPIIIQPDGDLTINYLDTHGLPLTAEHLSSATALVAKLVGVSADEDKQLAREAQIAKYIGLLYDDVFAEWSKGNETRMLELATYACALSRFRRSQPGMTTLDAFVDFRDADRTMSKRTEAWLADVTEEDALKFLKEPGTNREVRNLAFAYFTPAEYPTHRMLQELLQLESSDATAEDLATRLLPWCVGGNYGCLLDGESNISLTGKIAHFELGYIPEAAKLLRAVAGFLITNYARQHIVTMPRHLRKRIVYEEVARLLDIAGGEQIVKESYAQMRKFNCWNISIVQQYARFKESRIRSAVFGNSRQFFLMRQNDRSDLDDMGRDIGLTEVTKHAILSYPLPDQQSSEEKFAAFTYLHSDAQNPVCGTAHNVASPEMLYISGSSGAQFDERTKDLRGSEDIVAAIVQNAAPLDSVPQ